MYDSDYEENPIRLLLSIDDPEERARFARESGLAEDLARLGYFGRGAGHEVALNAAIYGGNEAGHLLAVMQDDRLVDDELATRAEAAVKDRRKAQYLSVDEVRGLYDATAFLNQEFGLTWTALITVAYKPLGITEADEAAELLRVFFDESRKFMRRAGYEFHWIYVFESSDERGLHTHILLHLPPGLRAAFFTWAMGCKRSFFRRHCRVVGAGAVDFKMKEPKTPKTKMQWQGDRLQYLTKGLDPHALARDHGDGKMKPVQDLLRQKENYRRPAGMVAVTKRCGGSGTVWRSAQAAREADGMPILSAFGDEAWQHLHLDYWHADWPLREYEVRQRQRDLQGVLARLDVPGRVGSDQWAWGGREWPIWERKSSARRRAVLAVKDVGGVITYSPEPDDALRHEGLEI